MTNKLNNINPTPHGEKNKLDGEKNKLEEFFQKVKDAVRKALTSAAVVAHLGAPSASIGTSTVSSLPTAATVITLGASSALLTACGPDEPEIRDTTPPNISVQTSEVDISGGKKVEISGNKLIIGGNIVASRSDNQTKECKVRISMNGNTISSGTTLNKAGTLTITVSDDSGNTKSATIKLNVIDTGDISGLENLKNLNMQVDHTVNLLQGITFANSVILEKVEILLDGQRTVISDPSKYTPEYPGTCSIILTIKDKNGKSIEYKVDNLVIKSLEYKDPTLSKVDVINKQYSWYNNLRQKNKEFIYPHILTSYAACNLYKLNNLEYVIMGEVPKSYDVEVIGKGANKDEHADEGYRANKVLSPEGKVKACGLREELEDYINKHPDKIVLASCASDAVGGYSLEELRRCPGYQPLKNILNKENVIINVAGGNRGDLWRKTLNENRPFETGGHYNSSSVNSNKNNKISAVGYSAAIEENVFLHNTGSSLPVGFDKNKGNIVMPFIPTVYPNNKEDPNTHSSIPTAAINSTIGNLVSIVMGTHPGITAEDAMTIIVNNYLRAEKFKYKNDAGQIVDGDYRYFFDMDKLIKTELLQSSKINSIQLNSDDVALPNPKGICYTGKGIQFEYNGKRYNVSDQSTLNQALKSGNIKWYWNKKAFLKYGGKGSASFDVHLVDKDGKKIPDIELKNITKNVG